MTPKGLFVILVYCLVPLLAACGEEAPSAPPAATSANATLPEAAPAAPAATSANATLPEAAPAARATARDPQALSPDAELEARKWNSYVILANEIDAGVLALLEDYVANFPDREYKAPDKNFVFRRLPGGERPRAVAGAVNEALAHAVLEPQSELDSLALAYAGALLELWQALNAAVAYFDGDGHKADAGAGGAALHAAVVEASQAYWPVSDAFGLALLRRDEEMMRASVSDLRKKGLPLHAAVLDLVLSARELERGLHGRFQDQSPDQASSDPAWTRATAKFGRACATLEKKLADAGQRQKEDLDEEAALALGTSARAMCACARDLAAREQKDAALEEFPDLMNVFIVNVNMHLQ